MAAFLGTSARTCRRDNELLDAWRRRWWWFSAALTASFIVAACFFNAPPQLRGY